MNNLKTTLSLGLALAALTPAFAADDIKIQVPGAQVPATPAATAVPEVVYTQTQAMEAYGFELARRMGLADLNFTQEEIEAIVKGLRSAAAHEKFAFQEEKIFPMLDTLLRTKHESWMSGMRTKNLQEGIAFFTELAKDKDLVSLPSGLRYKLLQAGQGAYPKATDSVKVHYTGKLINGTVFDSSVERGEPAVFALNGVIPGWTEGIQKVNKGGKIRLFVPPSLAYGDSPRDAIPPSSTLIFDVELLDIVAPEAPATAPVAAPAPATIK